MGHMRTLWVPSLLQDFWKLWAPFAKGDAFPKVGVASWLFLQIGDLFFAGVLLAVALLFRV